MHHSEFCPQAASRTGKDDALSGRPKAAIACLAGQTPVAVAVGRIAAAVAALAQGMPIDSQRARFRIASMR